MERDKFLGDTFDAAKYLSRLFCAECELTEDRKNLISAYLSMMWAVQHLKKKKGCEKISRMLSNQCSVITKFLWDKIVDHAWKK
jgi:hypothetical protein